MNILLKILKAIICLITLVFVFPAIIMLLLNYFFDAYIEITILNIFCFGTLLTLIDWLFKKLIIYTLYGKEIEEVFDLINEREDESDDN